MEDPEYQGLVAPDEPLNQSASQAMAATGPGGAGQMAQAAG